MSDFVAVSKEVKSYGMLTTPDGEILLDHLDKVFGFSSPAFIPSSDGTYDPLKAAIRDGQRQVFLHLKACAFKATHETPKKKTAIRD
jgi:hypothetical protein